MRAVASFPAVVYPLSLCCLSGCGTPPPPPPPPRMALAGSSADWVCLKRPWGAYVGLTDLGGS
jgi:hypothetical protein